MLSSTAALSERTCREWLLAEDSYQTQEELAESLESWEWFRSKEIGFPTSWNWEMLYGVSFLVNSCFKDRIGRDFSIALWPCWNVRIFGKLKEFCFFFLFRQMSLAKKYITETIQLTNCWFLILPVDRARAEKESCLHWRIQLGLEIVRFVTNLGHSSSFFILPTACSCNFAHVHAPELFFNSLLYPFYENQKMDGF